MKERRGVRLWRHPLHQNNMGAYASAPPYYFVELFYGKSTARLNFYIPHKQKQLIHKSEAIFRPR